MADAQEATGFQQQMIAVVEALENPSGNVLDVPVSLQQQDAGIVT